MFSSWSSSPENFRLVSGQNRENWVLKVGVVLLAISILHRKCRGDRKIAVFPCCCSVWNCKFFCHPCIFSVKSKSPTKQHQLWAPSSHDSDHLRVWNFQEMKNEDRRLLGKIFRNLASVFFITQVPQTWGLKFPIFKRSPFHARSSLNIHLVLKR